MAKSFDRLSLKRPCPVALPTMSADQRVAWCAHCGQEVHNLSAMTQADAAELLETQKGKACVAYLQQRDGRILFDLTRAIALGSVLMGSGCFWRGGKPPDFIPYTATQLSPGAAAGVVQLSVRDSNEMQLPNIKVRFFQDSGAVREGYTDAQGQLIVEGLSPGTWWVEVEGQREVFEMGRDMGVIGVLYVPS